MVRLTASAEGRLELEVTNIAQRQKGALACEVKQAGTCCVHAGRLAAALAMIASEEVSFLIEKRRLVLESEKVRYEFSTLDADEFPEGGFAVNTKFFSSVVLTGHELSALLAAVSPAVSQDATRYALNGVHFDLSESALSAVATDGRRLSLLSIPVRESSRDSNHASITIPADALSALRGLGHDAGEESLTLRWDEKSLVAEALNAAWFLRTSLIDVAFPSYRQVIPKIGLKKPVLISTVAWEEAIRACRAVAGKDSAISILDGRLELENLDEARTEYRLEQIGLTKSRVNSEYLADAMACCPTEKAQFSQESSSEPLLLSIDPKSPSAQLGWNWLHVVMPLRGAE